MNLRKEILRLTIPNVISNVTVPLLGMADMAIAGRLGHAAESIGALAIGTTIFNFIYWNCSFVRMGTSGLTAQAYGAGQTTECANLLGRGVVLAFVLALLLLLFQRPVGRVALAVMHGDALAERYFFARVWAIPAALSLFALNGWFIGMQNAVLPMVIALIQNVINIGCSIAFAFGCGWGIEGVAWGTVVAQWSGLAIALGAIFVRYRPVIAAIRLREIVRMKPVWHFMRVNRDIFIRSACITGVYTIFTAASARMDATVLAVNTLLMQLFTLFSYMSDGVAYAAEALTGRFVGARDGEMLRRSIRGLFLLSLTIAVAYVGIYLVAWRRLLGLFLESDGPERMLILSEAARYAGWVVVIPLAGFAPFLLDGIMIGATLTRALRNAMLLSLALFLGTYFLLEPRMGNNALWTAFVLFLVGRGILQYLFSDRLRSLYALIRPVGR